MLVTTGSKLRALLAASLLAGSAAGAQGFVSMPTNPNLSNTGQSSSKAFWNNFSQDGNNCNVGFVFAGIAGSAGSPCSNQKPAGWLPFTGTAPTRYLAGADGLAATNWLFGAGQYRVDWLGGGQSGSVAGVLSTFGYYGLGGADVALSAASPFSTTLDFASSWGFFIDPYQGAARARSGTDGKRFALFQVGNGGTFSSGVVNPALGAGNQTYYIGMEDGCETTTNVGGCGLFADYDNQDYLLRVTAVPEPSTYALMGAGLLALAAARYRRRRTA